MRKRYVVTNGDKREGFSKPAMESLKTLGIVKFIGTTKSSSGIVYNYVPYVVSAKEF